MEPFLGQGSTYTSDREEMLMSVFFYLSIGQPPYFDAHPFKTQCYTVEALLQSPNADLS